MKNFMNMFLFSTAILASCGSYAMETDFMQRQIEEAIWGRDNWSDRRSSADSGEKPAREEPKDLPAISLEFARFC